MSLDKERMVQINHHECTTCRKVLTGIKYTKMINVDEYGREEEPVRLCKQCYYFIISQTVDATREFMLKIKAEKEHKTG